MDRPGYVSLFSSAGVGCYGFNLEGFDCIATSELISRRIEIQKYNNVCSLDGGYISGDITQPNIQQKIIDQIGLWKQTYNRTDIDVVIATPPCQGISVANHKKNNELKRNSLVVQSLSIIDQVNPKFFVLENVRGFLSAVCTDTDGTNKSIQDAIMNNLAGHYNIAHRVLNFKDYGNNSSRTRTLVIGVRKDILELSPYELFPESRPVPTLRDTIGDWPRLVTMVEVSPRDADHSFCPDDVCM